MSFGAAVAIAAVLTFAAGLLVIVQTAILHIRRARAVVLTEESLRDQDGRSVKRSKADRGRISDLVLMLDDRVRSLAVVHFLVLAGRLTAVAVLAVTVADGSGALWAAVAVGILLVVGFVLTDVVPRAIALRALDMVALRSARVVIALDRLAPLRWAAAALVAVAERILPRTLRSSGSVVSEEELLAVAERAFASDAIDAGEHELIESVIAFGDTLIREVMVPRPDMGCVAAELSVADAMAVAATNGFSRIPVSGSALDDIVGVVHAKDLMRAHLDGRDNDPVRDLARAPRFVPETKQADHLLREMQAERYHLAIVVDEYGGTAGLVTMEDLLEEVVGEIVDEFDHEEPLSQALAGGEVRVHGRMPIDELSSLLGGPLPVGDWDTIGGLLFDALGHVPEPGEVVEVAGRNFAVEQVVGRRITRIRIGEAKTGGTTE